MKKDYIVRSNKFYLFNFSKAVCIFYRLTNYYQEVNAVG